MITCDLCGGKTTREESRDREDFLDDVGSGILNNNDICDTALKKLKIQDVCDDCVDIIDNLDDELEIAVIQSYVQTIKERIPLKKLKK